MLTKHQLRIFGSFMGNLFREYAIKEIKKGSGEKSNNAISIALKRFREEGLVKERVVGRSKLYSLNIENDPVFHYLALINRDKLPKPAMKALEQVKMEVMKHTSFFSIVVFGSYSAGEQKKDSDLDIAVFVENEEMKKKVQLALNSVRLKSVMKVDLHAISQEEFLEMLGADYANVGKEIARNHLSIYNPAIFYSMLSRGVKNGFEL